jgi:hypothetical protein
MDGFSHYRESDHAMVMAHALLSQADWSVELRKQSQVLSQRSLVDRVRALGASEGKRGHESEALIGRKRTEPLSALYMKRAAGEIVQERVVAEHLLEQEVDAG